MFMSKYISNWTKFPNPHSIAQRYTSLNILQASCNAIPGSSSLKYYALHVKHINLANKLALHVSKTKFIWFFIHVISL